MCGIIGAVAAWDIVPALLQGLKRLEYRGYDSAGLVVALERLHCMKRTGPVQTLLQAAEKEGVKGAVGIAHTRWATHGKVSVENTHPHVSVGTIAIVHNGIIENHATLRSMLSRLGYEFISETDSEVIAHLVHYFGRHTDLLNAVRQAVGYLEGSYAFVAISANEPNCLVCARQGSPLLVGIADGACFIASDTAAFLNATRDYLILEDGDVAHVMASQCAVYNRFGRAVERPIRTGEVERSVGDRGVYRHFMHKEIHEQPQAITDTLADVRPLQDRLAKLFGNGAEVKLQHTRHVRLLACGSSLHAAMVARRWLEELAGISATAEIASEERYQYQPIVPNTLVVAISQSGETADTLGAVAAARNAGLPVLAIGNRAESALIRDCPLHFLTRAGSEIGVAATKSFTTQLIALYLLALAIGQANGRLSMEMVDYYLAHAVEAPTRLRAVLDLEPDIAGWAERLTTHRQALYLGRGIHYPIAIEGALKLKEISYIHAEAYPAGELKHGPLALVDAEMPVVAVMAEDRLKDKLHSNLMEVCARGGQVYLFASATCRQVAADSINVIGLPIDAGPLSPLFHTVPLQLLAYHVAVHRGIDVDRPRNLAKSVTVE